MFTQAGFEVGTYPYYDAGTRGIRFEAMLAALNAALPGHRGRAARLLPQPDRLRPECRAVGAAGARCSSRGGLVPFLDMAYQGFGDGIVEDGAAVQLLLAAGVDFFVATSFSKSFSLYGERVGALSVVCASKDEAARVLSRLKVLIRGNYSNPPTHGAQVVALVLTTPDAAPHVGRRARRHAPTHPPHARGAGAGLGARRA